MDIFSASKGNVFPFEIGGDLRGGGWGGGKRQLTSLVVFSVVHMRFISVPDVMGDFEESGREETFFFFLFKASPYKPLSGETISYEAKDHGEEPMMFHRNLKLGTELSFLCQCSHLSVPEFPDISK